MSNKELFHAVKNGDTNSVKDLISKEINLNQIDENGSTIFREASVGGHVDIMNLLIDAGMNINIQDKNGMTPIMYAAFNGQIEILNKLLSKKVDTLIRDYEGMSPLMFAVVGGYLEATNILLKTKLEIDRFTKDYPGITGKNALMMAIEKGNMEIIRTLLLSGANVNLVNSLKRTAVMLAIENNKLEVLKLLIRAGGIVDTIDSWGITPLMLAVERRRSEMVKELLKTYRGNINFINEKGDSALIIAVSKFDYCPEIISDLISSGASPYIRDKNGKNAEDHAIFKETLELLKQYRSPF